MFVVTSLVTLWDDVVNLKETYVKRYLYCIILNTCDVDTRFPTNRLTCHQELGHNDSDWNSHTQLSTLPSYGNSDPSWNINIPG